MYTTFQVVLKVKSYIAHPYWPEKDEAVDILKKSGCNKKRTEQARSEALLRYLEQIGMSAADFDALVKRGDEPWYRDDHGYIMIPRHHISACLVQACKSAPSTARVAYEQFRSLIQLSDFGTEKQTHDEKFKRFILPTDGKGRPISNQRRLTVNDVIKDFEAQGTISLDPDEVKPETARALLVYAGKYIGVGAARKMGYGRFAVAEMREVADVPEAMTAVA